MSEHQDPATGGASDTDSMPVERPDESSGQRSAPRTGPEPRSGGRRGGGAIAWLALLVALAAAGGSAWLGFRNATGQAADAGRGEALATLAEQTDALADRLESVQTDAARSGAQMLDRIEDLAGRVEALSADAGNEPGLERIEQRLEALAGEQSRSLEALRARIEQAEVAATRAVEQVRSRLADLDASVASADRGLIERLRLIRVDALLATGQDALRLGPDIDTARAAWQRAAALVADLDGGRFAELERRIDAELRQLEGLDASAGPGRAEAVFAAAAAVPGWPLAGGTDDAAPSGSGDGARETPTGRLRDVFGQLVRVERVDDEILDPAERDRVRERVATLLTSVGLALARERADSAAGLAETAVEWITEGFRIESAPVAQAVELLQTIVEAPLPEAPEVPEGAREELARLLGDSA